MRIAKVCYRSILLSNNPENKLSRLALLNMFLGFLVVSLAAAAGSFIGLELTQGFLKDPEMLSSWRTTLLTSAHGHTNLFGMLHVLFGLTLPYSVLSTRIKVLQTAGIAAGVVAMGPIMFIRANLGPAEQMDIFELLIGVLLSCALAAVATHSYGIAAKLFRR